MTEEVAPPLTAEELAIMERVMTEALAEGRDADFAEVLLALLNDEDWSRKNPRPVLAGST